VARRLLLLLLSGILPVGGCHLILPFAPPADGRPIDGSVVDSSIEDAEPSRPGESGTETAGDPDVGPGTDGMALVDSGPKPKDILSPVKDGPVPFGDAVPACGPATCALGCCSSGTCLPPSKQSSQSCGTGGWPCISCGNDYCSSIGTCLPPSCGTCSGCCQGTMCVSEPLVDAFHCGLGGEPCKNCDKTGLDCCNGKCTTYSCP